MNIQQITIELGIAASYSLCYVYLLDIGQEYKEKIQWVGIGLVMTCMCVNLGFTLFYLVIDILARFRAYRARNCTVHPDHDAKMDDSMNERDVTDEPDIVNNVNLDISHDTTIHPIIRDDSSPLTYHFNSSRVTNMTLENIFYSRLNRRRSCLK